MKIIICGAGQVGFHIARQLAAERHDVAVIDQSPDLVRRVGDSLDVQAFVGFASHPDVLERAGASDIDMIIAVTQADEVNMIACQVAHSLFNVPTKIARVRHQSYLQPIWADLFSRDHMPIDVIISPEIEVARAISRRLQMPGAFESIVLADGSVRMMGVRCGDDCPVINTPLRQLTGIFPDLNIVVVAVVRDGRGFVPSADDQMLAGDDVYFVADADHIARSMVVFGHEETVARRVIIAGGGHIGAFLGEIIEKEHAGVAAKIIESNADRAHAIADELERTIVINGDVIDPEILDEASVSECEAIIAVTNDDETNILASLLAKRFGTRRAVTLINNATYTPLITSLGIDVVVNPRSITVSTILQHVRRGRIRAVHSLAEGFGELIEAEILETSGLSGLTIGDADLPDGVLFGAIVRGGEVIIPRADTVMRVNDRVVLFAEASAVKAIENLFAVRLEFF
ncbi:MAG: Trk system potassium transporter TrkA [Rhodospirillaceae bacterium]|jgi:trk system potassium uptake protein|nr:Trk system potassium transporter TrkA [Rhodospirillaceae bacterium]MBT5456753.1 Trk system potassium transporter TrkA [Rhodospirillaceae bacterium]